MPVSVSQMNLYWTLNATNATAIEVARSDDGGAYATLAASAGGGDTMFTDTTVSEGHAYSYEIRAVQPIGDSAYSDPAVATTFAVQGLVATAASTTEIDLSWLNLSSDPNATLDVQRSSDGGDTFTTIATGLPAGTTTFNDLGTDPAGLLEGTHYFYQVLLHEPDVPAMPTTLSDPADAWTLPAAPTGLTVTPVGSGEVDLSWSNVSGGADGVEVWRADSGGVFQLIDTLDPAATSYADTSVADGTQYIYRIIATVNGAASAVLQGDPLTTPQAAPYGLAAVTAP
ncbi:MAG TPA: fibronectin type III domain-containing protein, partial [Tepidisphaeraceae bacterium]|nr:fibronectin type III domain-containing protein [Tepidisphaeraceae bacterium]